MLDGTGWDNQRWVKLLIDQFIKLGIDQFFLSPGSRNTPLLIATAEHPKAKAHIHYDERGSAFQTLGFGKATGKPAVFICTSGTGVGNALPAIMEADASFTPMVVLTADRPPELRNTGANQTTEQAKIFQNHVRWQIDLACPGREVPEAYAATSIAQAVYRSQHAPCGPVHVNVMLREPFFSDRPLDPPPTFFTSYGETEINPALNSIAAWKNSLDSAERGVILVGAQEHWMPREAIYALAEKLQWPIFSDPISGLRMDGLHRHHIHHHDLLLKIFPDWKPDAVLHFGDRLVSKSLLQWLSISKPAFYGLAAAHPCRHDPSHQVTHRLACSSTKICQALLPLIPQRNTSDWLEQWQNASHLIGRSMDAYFENESILSEPRIFHWLKKNLPEDWALFIANSMPIRDADNYYYPETCASPLFANRGVSGIDGNVATAVGIAKGLRKPVAAVLGDLTFLHDLNSLALLRDVEFPVLLIVINNGGGGIFSFLPVVQRTPHFEKIIATAHDLHFTHAAHLFGLPYSSSDDWENGLKTLFDNYTSGIIEIKTDRSENYQLHQQLLERARHSCCTLTA